MADRPILFSKPMVRALLDGRKTQTRRVLNPQPAFDVGGFRKVFSVPPYFEARDLAGRPHVNAFPLGKHSVSPYPSIHFAVGDRLWVRETWSHSGDHVFEISQARTAGPSGVIYRADDNPKYPHAKFWPSIFMPREFSRLTLLVDDVRVERLQDISEVDAIAEGIEDVTAEVAPRDPAFRFWRRYRDGGWQGYVDNPIGSYASLWTEINGAGSWEANPWVVAVTSRVLRANIDQVAE